MVKVGLLVLVMRGQQQVLVMRDLLEVLEMRGLERIDLAKIDVAMMIDLRGEMIEEIEIDIDQGILFIIYCWNRLLYL
jgi:hypothetical protein